MANICTKCSESENDCQCPDPYELEQETYEPSQLDYLTMALQAVQLVDCLDPITKDDKERVKSIKSKSLEIAHVIISDIYGVVCG